MLLYMYIDLGQGLTTPWGRNFDVNRNILSRLFVASLKKILFEVWFYKKKKFIILCMYIAPGQRQTAPRGQSFDTNKLSCHFIHSLQFWKKCLWSLILNNFFHDLIHAYSPRAGADRMPQTKFCVNRKALSFYPFVTSLKKISLKSDFIQFFFMI